jgi:pimeloyl-ACP methyl ester carboxylesterase
MAAGSSTFTWGPNLTLASEKSPFESPLPSTHTGFSTDVQPISWERYNVAGILLTVYGLEELPENKENVTCLWLLHGRGDTQDSMSFIAAAMIRAWNKRKQENEKSLICVSFDQRNHGSRMIDNRANESWNAGNPTHGPDMYTLFTGTAQDVSQLISHLPAYLPFRPRGWMCGGVSLGAHATWHCVLHDSRITAGIMIIGCADYANLMTDRAIRSKLPSCTSTDPPGQKFLGSKDFPPSLLEAIRQRDPAGLLLGELDDPNAHTSEPTEGEKARLRPILREKLAGKKLLVLSGGKDRLVPYQQSEPFLSWLSRALDKNSGWFGDCGTSLIDILDPEARHEFSALMRDETESWLCEVMSGRLIERIRRNSKM